MAELMNSEAYKSWYAGFVAGEIFMCAVFICVGWLRNQHYRWKRAQALKQQKKAAEHHQAIPEFSQQPTSTDIPRWIVR